MKFKLDGLEADEAVLLIKQLIGEVERCPNCKKVQHSLADKRIGISHIAMSKSQYMLCRLFDENDQMNTINVKELNRLGYVALLGGFIVKIDDTVEDCEIIKV